MEEVKCKVCNQMFPLTETFCTECGFERHIYPEPLSPELKKYEEERVNKYKEQRTKQEKELKKQEDAFDEVSSQLSEARDTLKKSEEELKTAETEAQANKQKIAQLEKDLADAQLKASKAKGEKPKAFLLIKDGQRESVGAVYEGRNTYGCFLGGITDNNHQELIIEGLKPLHFSIEAIGDHYRLFDLVGDVKSGRNPISDRGVSLHNGESIVIGSNITITFIITL